MTVMTVRMFSNMKVDFLAKWLLSVLDSSQVLLMMQTLLSMILPNEPIMLLESSLSIGWDDNYDDETLSHSIIVLRFYRFYRQLWVLDYRVMSWTVIWCCIMIMIVLSLHFLEESFRDEWTPWDHIIFIVIVMTVHLLIDDGLFGLDAPTIISEWMQ